jgi:hypothetical protein
MPPAALPENLDEEGGAEKKLIPIAATVNADAPAAGGQIPVTPKSNKYSTFPPPT